MNPREASEHPKAAQLEPPYDTRCYQCGAPRGACCRTPLNGAVTLPHAARRALSLKEAQAA